MSAAVTAGGSASGSKRKKSEVGFAVEDKLPEYLHYMGNPPKENSAAPGLFSTPVIPFYSNAFNYGLALLKFKSNWYFGRSATVLMLIKVTLGKSTPHFGPFVSRNFWIAVRTRLSHFPTR